MMAAVAGAGYRVVDFPIANEDASRRFADGLLSEFQPSVLIAIERCGPAADGLYRNWRGLDISGNTARVDHLFSEQQYTVGIGDGGNEVGMGSLASVISTVPSLVRFPCVTGATRLVISSVSNWGGYGLVAALSRRSGRDLLPSVEEEREMVKRAVHAGAVDGFSGKSEYKVDGFSLEENSQTVARLHGLLADEGISP